MIQNVNMSFVIFKTIWHVFNDTKLFPDIVGDILLGLTVKRSKVAVINKILELGLVSDRKELHKKPKGRGRKKNEEEDGREDGFMEGKINPLCAKFFRGNKNIYLHFMSILSIDMTQVIGILPCERPRIAYFS